jgi:penicillin-binding protein-related factor A (putative recombinase)
LFFIQDNERKSIPIEYFENMAREIKVEKKRTTYMFDIKEWLGDYK